METPTDSVDDASQSGELVLRLIDHGVVRIGALSEAGRQRDDDVGIGERVRGRTSAATELLA